MNENWIRWILLSIFQHYKDNVDVSPAIFYIPAQEGTPDISVDRVELAYMGPNFSVHTENEISGDILINMLVVTNKDPTNLMYHEKMLGKVIQFFTNCIPIYKYGSNTDTDTQAQVGQLSIKSKVNLVDLLTFDPVTSQRRSTLEAVYTINFE